MPSWNIHTAHVERLAREVDLRVLGVGHPDAFLLGNYVPDVYVGFMVPDATFRVAYCITHVSGLGMIPLPDPDKFWDDFVCFRRPKGDAAVSLTLGAWAHLLTDRVYNERFRAFCREHEVPEGELLRIGKQADFASYGRSLHISRKIAVSDELLQAAKGFRPYSVLAQDVERTVKVADAIVDESQTTRGEPVFQVLDREWMDETFEACHLRLREWLATWHEHERGEDHLSAAQVGELCRQAAV